MELSDDYKQIVKLRFNNLTVLPESFFNVFYKTIQNPKSFNSKLFNDFCLNDILYFLQKSHLEYLNVWYPKIESISKDIQLKKDTNELTLTLNTFLVNYFNELSNHINFEEKVLYNFVTKLLNGTYIESEKMFVLNHFLETHSHAIEDDLISIQKRLINIDDSIKKDSLFQNLFELFNLIHNDLQVHGLIEEEVFMDKIHQFIDNNF